MIVSLRHHALIIGFSLALFPYVEKIFLPLIDYGGSFLTGIFLGSALVMILGHEYLKNGRTLEASYAFRICYLLPGDVSDRAVAFLDSMVSRVRNRTVQFFAVNILEKVFRFLLRNSIGYAHYYD